MILTTMQHQGVSAKMFRENSLTQYGGGNILGVLRAALPIVAKEYNLGRGAQNDRRGEHGALASGMVIYRKKSQPLRTRSSTIVGVLSLAVFKFWQLPHSSP